MLFNLLGLTKSVFPPISIPAVIDEAISGTDELMNGVGRMLRVRKLEVSFRNKLMTISYKIVAVSSLFNSA